MWNRQREKARSVVVLVALRYLLLAGVRSSTNEKKLRTEKR